MNTATMQRQGQAQHVERTRHRRVAVPPTDINETEEAIVLFADMPGVSDKEANITLEKDLLTIEGNQEEEGRPGYVLTYAEYDTSDYRRVFTLSADVQRDGIEASVKDGVLRLALPKAEPAKARRIAVKAG